MDRKEKAIPAFGNDLYRDFSFLISMGKYGPSRCFSHDDNNRVMKIYLSCDRSSFGGLGMGVLDVFTTSAQQRQNAGVCARRDPQLSNYGTSFHQKPE